MKNLTEAQKKYAKTWFLRLTWGAQWAEIPDNATWESTHDIDSSFKRLSQTILSTVTDRSIADIDNTFEVMSNLYRCPDSAFNSTNRRVVKSAEELANYMGWLCQECGINWDNSDSSLYSKQELEEFKKTYLGQAIDFYDCYTVKQHKVASKHPTNGISKASGTGTSSIGGAPKNGYKSSGPQSANVRDLHGVPNQKVLANTTWIFRIIGENSNSRTVIPTVFVRPLSPRGQTGSTNKVFVGSANGYTDCTVFFDDLNAANNFLDKLSTNGSIPNNITNLHIVKLHADTNGYFLIGTEFGEVAIAASKLNEAINEDISANVKHLPDRSYRDAFKQKLDEMAANGISYVDADDVIEFGKELSKSL